MVVTHKDIFFANISGVDHGECHLDLYLPDKLQTCRQAVPNQDVNEENNTADDWRYENLEEVRTATNEEDNYLTNCSKEERKYVQKSCVRSETNSYYTREGIDTRITGVPLILFIHGGGWRRGGRAAWRHYLYFDVNFLVAFLQYFIGSYGNIGEALAENSIACAVISYPLTEAGPLTLLFEMFLSYIQSVFFVFLVCLPLIGTSSLLQNVNRTSPDVTHELDLKSYDAISILSTVFFLALLVTNIFTSVLFLMKRRKYNISKHQIRWFSIGLLASLIAASYTSKPEYVLVVLTLAINQSVIFYQRSKRHGSTYEEQIKAVALAVRWAKRFSQETGHTDANRIYLMGHSAGGHLATLSALDESVLAAAACSITDIKGIISVSGVYDLLCLNKHWLRPVYLEPTFGRDCTTWFEASPEHLAKRNKTSSTMPRFLLMLAERDLFLKSQSFKFAKTLEELQYDCQHVEICKANHFSIVTNTSTKEGTTLSYVLDFVQ